MQLDVGSVKSIAGVVTQGRSNAHQWVTSYQVEASDDEKAWTKVDCGRTFAGNVDQNTVVNGRFNKPITARYIRVFVRSWYGWASMRAGVLLCDSNYAQRKPSSWEMRVYKANGDMWDLPDVSTLTYVGTGKPTYIDFKDVNDIRKFVPGVPEKNFAAIVTGTVEIRTAGEYKFCGQSSDGSTIKVDDEALVENEGMHAKIEKCKSTKLKAGPHKVQMSYFQSTGDIDMEATYAGPDTADAPVSLPANDFEMSLYSSPTDLLKKPDISTLTQIGQKVSIPEVNFHSLLDFKKYVPDAPAEYFAIDFYGTVHIDEPGNYYFCTISDDGSRLWIDDEAAEKPPLIDNSGLHGDRRYCNWKQMSKGDHKVHGDYFQGGGGMHMQVTYRGPDTDDKDEDLRSEGGTLPKRVPESKWEMRLFQTLNNKNIGNNMPNVGLLNFFGSVVVPAIDFNSLEKLQRYYPKLKTVDNIAIQWFGEHTINKPGNYLFCTESKDGSRLWFNGEMVVNNGGTHGNQQICGWQWNVQPGTYFTKVDCFNALGSWNVKVSYQGSDTDNKRMLLGSKSASGPPNPYESHWQMRMFMANSQLDDVPDPATMQPVGDAVVPYIDFRSLEAFRTWIPSVPDTNVVAKISGSFDIKTGGTYEFCSESAYGSHVWLSGNMLIDNGGVHVGRKKCTNIALEAGKVPIVVDMFTSYYGILKITYEGPDTEGKRKAVASPDLEMQLYADDKTLSTVPPSLEGLRKIGVLEKIPAIYFENLAAFRAVVPGVPYKEYSAVFTGKITIRTPGVYMFCCDSQDGSVLTIDGSTVVDNDGRNGRREKCGSKTLKKGEYDTKAEMFQSSSGGYMVVKYQGSDTWGIKELLGSTEPAAFKRGEVSKWTMRIFNQPMNRGWLEEMPNFSWLDFDGEAPVTAIDFKNVPDIRRYVPDTPTNNIAGAWFGKTKITVAGDYSFCTTSGNCLAVLACAFLIDCMP
jgi:hypothetical protein